MSGFYCEHCGRKLRYTHDDKAICLTDKCPNNPSTKDPKIKYADDYDG